MSKIKVIEGIEYIEKSSVDEIISSRLSKYADKNRELETRVEQYQQQIDEAKSSMGLVEKLNSQIDQLTGELSTARSQYERHSTIGKYGIIDPQIRDAVEWTFDREMSSRPKKDQVSLNDWMESISKNPENAPALLRPFFNPAPTSSSEQSPTSGVPENVPMSIPQQPNPTIPQQPPTMIQSNNGVRQSGIPTGDILSRASNPDFYSKNREAIREAFYSQRKK
jgi:hypothetical protein